VTLPVPSPDATVASTKRCKGAGSGRIGTYGRD